MAPEFILANGFENHGEALLNF